MNRGEDQLVAWFQSHTEIPASLCPAGIGDDMATLRWPEAELCITTDLLLEGVHFERDEATLEQIGYKAMGASLSDCAAMATVPVAAVVSLGLGPEDRLETIQTLHAGLSASARAFDCPIVGGDTTRGHAGLVVNVAMLSRPPAGGHPVTRCGARPGDVIGVTGELGGSRAAHHLCFRPRVPEALALVAETTLHAMMDLSDGLSTDLTRLCHASGVGAVVQAAALPLRDPARAASDPVAAALNDGEDFELLFTLDVDAWEALRKRWDRDVPLTRIGTVTADPSCWLADARGGRRPLRPGGYDHLRDGGRDRG